MRILVIEDDLTVGEYIELVLKGEGFNVCRTDRGEDGVDLGRCYDFDIILLDLNLPDLHGNEVARRLRSGGVRTPILILSGLKDTDDKLKAFELGVDDYLTKPFDAQELVVRILAIVRRANGHAQSVVVTGRLSVDLHARVALVDDKRLKLSAKEFATLELLALRKGTTLSKDTFLDHLYGGLDDPIQKIIDVFICKLRRKIAIATGGEHYIETDYSRGFVLRDPEQDAEPLRLAS